MEVNDEVVERQKLVTNDIETEDEPTASKSAPTPASPVVASKVNYLTFFSIFCLI